VNIEVIKYWGKRDSKLILPTNSYLSLTLNQSDLRSKNYFQVVEMSVDRQGCFDLEQI
ncbi:hypothetical protein BY996DRAFT_4589640, partial [Phakopsora pachyrhizi]